MLIGGDRSGRYPPIEAGQGGTMSATARFGVTGLAVMGANLARNVAHHDIPIAVHNRTTARTETFMADHGTEGPITGTESVADFVAAVERPRTVMVMVKAGAPVDAVIAELVPHLEPGDTIIDGGNSFFRDTQQRTRTLADQGLRFLGVGVSGGEEGALNGPSIMPGGDHGAYDDVAGVLTTIAAQVDGTPCCTYVGPDGAGHYVKMVHNGIEYADIQLITEAYDLLRQVVGLEVPEIAATFDGWNHGDLESYLIEITAIVLAKTDEATGGPLVDVILDRAEQKGTGRWTAQDALELGVPLTAITEAVFARSLSALGDERATASERLGGPRPGEGPVLDRSFVDDVHHALFASKVVAYAQGFDQLAAASATEGWGVDLGAMATIWRGGCIIRAAFLDRIREAYEADPDLANLLFAGYFGDAVAGAQDSWRRVVSVAAERGVAVPAFSSALAWYDGYRRERGPASLIQGLRDHFGAHTYRRVDREGSFHTRWAQDGREVRTDS
jgi:6-phosphogluconate dehydrogenase